MKTKRCSSPRYCRPCKDAGKGAVVATRVLEGHGPCCTPCAAERYRPLRMSPITVPHDLSDEEIEAAIQSHVAEMERPVMRTCSCGCGMRLTGNGHKDMLPGHPQAVGLDRRGMRVEKGEAA